MSLIRGALLSLKNTRHTTFVLTEKHPALGLTQVAEVMDNSLKPARIKVGPKVRLSSLTYTTSAWMRTNKQGEQASKRQKMKGNTTLPSSWTRMVIVLIRTSLLGRNRQKKPRHGPEQFCARDRGFGIINARDRLIFDR